MTSIAKTGGVSMNSVNSNMPVPDRYIEHPGYTEYVYKTSASTGKKIGVGLGSWFMPGLGQCINGQWGKGVGMFLGTLALAYTPLIAVAGSMKSGKSAKMGALAIAGWLGAFALQIISTVDAVKHAKSETVQIVPKDNTTRPNVNYSA